MNMIFDNFELKVGARVTVMFTNGNSQSLPSLNVSGTGAKVIQVIRGGQKITPELIEGYWRTDSAISSEMWQPYTILDFIYDGTNWVICGNPVVESYTSGSSGYNIYADGKIELWDWYYTSTPLTTITYNGVNYNNSVAFKIRFKSIPSMTTSCKSTSSNEISYNEWLYPSTPICFTRNRGKSYDFDSPWIAVGY